MKQHQLTSIAYKAMQDAMADGLNIHAVIQAGSYAFANGNRSIAECNGMAQALYDKHFTVKEPN